MKQHQFLDVVDRDEAERRFATALGELADIGSEEIDLGEALSRVLADDVTSAVDVPGFDRSNMDGYAVRAEDTFGASEAEPLRLARAASDIAIGALPAAPLAAGEAMAIPTGGALPRGADAVLMVEHTELFGDEVESIRSFDVATQRSIKSRDSVELTLLQPNRTNRTHFTSYLPAESWFLLVEPNQLTEEGGYYHQRLEHPEDFFATSTTLSEIYKFPSVTASGIPAGSFETTAHLQFESIERFSGDVHRVREELDEAAAGHRVYLVAETEAEVQRLTELFDQTQLAA